MYSCTGHEPNGFTMTNCRWVSLLLYTYREMANQISTVLKKATNDTSVYERVTKPTHVKPQSYIKSAKERANVYTYSKFRLQ